LATKPKSGKKYTNKNWLGQIGTAKCVCQIVFMMIMCCQTIL
jgi:hypothetical protein